LFALALSVDAYAQPPAQPSLAPMIERISPAVVNISVSGSVPADSPAQDEFFRRFFDFETPPDGRREVEAAGSGVIVDAAKGYILTNHHVIENADKITVTLLDNRSLSAKVIGSDKGTDLAVLQVSSAELKSMPLGDSNKLRVGDYVVAIGNPFGFSNTVTSGIVSALGRSGINRDAYEDFIQTDASINPGNSGGALVNLSGELVGINSAILSRSGGNIGIGFAIPVNMVRAVMEQLVTSGAVHRGLLGVNIDDITPDLAATYGLHDNSGALVRSMQANSAAEKAGIQVGDVIVTVNGSHVRDSARSKRRSACYIRASKYAWASFATVGSRWSPRCSASCRRRQSRPQKRKKPSNPAASRSSIRASRAPKSSRTIPARACRVCSSHTWSPAAPRRSRACAPATSLPRSIACRCARLRTRLRSSRAAARSCCTCDAAIAIRSS